MWKITTVLAVVCVLAVAYFQYERHFIETAQKQHPATPDQLPAEASLSFQEIMEVSELSWET